MLRTHDDWERLVGAVLKKQQLWELFHAHSRTPSMLSEASSSSDFSSLSFREIDTSSANWQQLEDAVARFGNRVQKLVLVSDFIPSFDVGDVKLNSLELLGTGTFGNTYAGDVSDGVKIVVKRIHKSVDVSEEQFKRSMDIVARVGNENVVPLRAYCCYEDEKLMMYDYYSEGNVYELLHGQTSQIQPRVSWETRLRIAIGAARGLASIHAQHGGKLVHGNIKSTNIFINHESYGSISDFGMINLIAAKFRQNERCHAPEVKNSTQNVSQESDVYSFGILLFELLTRKPSVQVLGGPDVVDLVKLMKSVKSTNMTSKVFDWYLVKDLTIRVQMVRVLQIGLRCVSKSVKKRPKISEVSKILEDCYIYSAPKVLDSPKRPALVFSNHNAAPFDLEDLWSASAEVLGKGTFGTSYRACLKSGMEVRVKRIKNVNVSFEEFKRHVEVIGRIEHGNCAKVMAYYFSKDEVFLLYNHYNENSLSVLLHGNKSIRKPLAWHTRLQIALTLAKGIAHIHTLDGSKLVHGNIDSSNIFFARYIDAIITDTALWKVAKPIQISAPRHQGYFAPEVEDTRNVSQASDVYSIGVVLLELLTRRRPRETRIPDLASTVLDIESIWYEEAIEVLQLAIDCLEDAPERRPTMYMVVKRLEQIGGIYEEESEPQNGRSRLEDALEVQLSKLTVQQRKMLRTRDNWERLVGAVIKKQQLWELCHAHSRSSSVLSYMLSARDLSITLGNTKEYWRWIHLPNSRFDKVAELLDACWLEIRGRINTSALSPNTNYVAVLVFATRSRTCGLEKPVEAAVTINGEGKKRSVCLDPSRRYGLLYHLFLRQDHEINNQQPTFECPKQREDGWFEVELGEFLVKEGAEGEGELEISLMDVKILNWKSGLIIEGIEIRPKVCRVPDVRYLLCMYVYH